jgi:hypothetical protein
MTTQPEDKIYWGGQLERLPTMIRAAIVAVRLGGQTVVIMALVGILIGIHLGAFPDQASKDREILIRESKQQSEELHQNSMIQAQQLRVLEEHARTARATVMVLCANLAPGTYERGQCLEILGK